ncbi:GIY-YIG nuclease family protein [uncultured Clostridium sp.]|jgi:putative endonuclease|uniref:GIY-YIG nuclease family protein n=1 Tax=uncultured Clostridium sp. TaxID=59620 RepID=UPI002603D3E3|nr:GIY-YIG nuclease family protein [uncultured Clostridium sp.]
MNYVYILECVDGTLYTGWTNNLEKRLDTHNKGKGAKYTRARLPVKLSYSEEFEDKRDAQKREYSIKQLKRSDKLKLIGGIL